MMDMQRHVSDKAKYNGERAQNIYCRVIMEIRLRCL